MQKITPFLWFNGQAEEAAKFYCSLFKKSKIIETRRYGKAGPGKEGAVMYVTFRLNGEEFIALNGNAEFKFNLAVSFFVRCQTQREVDTLWAKLAKGGKEIQCGWITDKYGLTWQIVPNLLMEMMADKDPVKSQRVMQAMMQMVKFDIKALKKAYKNT